MQITVTTEDGKVFPLDISNELTLQDLQALLELETGIAQHELLLVHTMSPMVEREKTLAGYGVEEGDVIMVSRVEGGVMVGGASAQQQAGPSISQPFIDWSTVTLPPAEDNEQGRSHQRSAAPTQGGGHHQGQQAPPTSNPNDPETIRQHFLRNPPLLAQLQQRNPPLAEAILSGNVTKLKEILECQRQALREAERERIRMINADPLDPRYQAKIAQEIQRKNIEENMEAAIEYTPESFSRVVMLYLEIRVNGVPVKALVDSGARSTIMSQACAERCNIMRLVDQRFAGMAFGVGHQRIIGRVHLGQIQIGHDFLTSSFQVLESAAEDMLLGLDMLRRHLCCIDLKDNCLRIGTTGAVAPFLTEKDLKEKEAMEMKQVDASMQAEDYDMAQAIARSEGTGNKTEKKKEEEDGDDGSEGEMKRKKSKLGSSHRHPSPSPHTPSQAREASMTLFSEEAIRQITSAGFSRDQAIQSLQRHNGDVQLALATLIASSIKF